MTADPTRALELNTLASLEFLCAVMPTRHVKLIERGVKQSERRIFQIPILDELPSEHKPKDKNLAQKLGQVSAFKDRFLPKMERKLKRATPNTDAAPENEVWMHIAATDREVEKYRKSMGESWLPAVKDDAESSETDSTVQGDHYISRGDKNTTKREAPDHIETTSGRSPLSGIGQGILSPQATKVMDA
jgi:hypothetical protein